MSSGVKAGGQLSFADVRDEEGRTLQEAIDKISGLLDGLESELDGMDTTLAELIGEDAE